MQQNMFPLPHQINMNRPPPPLMHEMDMNQQKKSWIHNHSGNDLGDECNMMSEQAPPSLLGAPPNFMSPNHRNSFPGSFRGNRGGKMIRGGANNVNNTSPYNNFRGRGGGIRPRGRGGFRGNFKGQGQPW